MAYTPQMACYVVFQAHSCLVHLPCLQGVPQNILGGVFSRFTFTRLCCVLKPPSTVSADQRAALLCATLHQLGSTVQPPRALAVEMHSTKSKWTPELLQAVSDAAADLPQLHVTLSVGTLNDALLDRLLQHAPAVSGVRADSLRLRDTRHSNTLRPWSSLAVGKIDHIKQVLCLPTPREGSRLVEGLERVSLNLTSKQASGAAPVFCQVGSQADAVTKRCLRFELHSR